MLWRGDKHGGLCIAHSGWVNANRAESVRSRGRGLIICDVT